MKRVTSTARLTAASIFFVGATITGALAASEFDGPGFHHGKGPGLLTRFIEIDTNNDNQLSLEEMQIHAANRFDRADENSDGVMTEKEVRERMKERINDRLGFIPGRADKRINFGARRIIDELDLNGDGKVTKMEQSKQLTKRFALADRNDDTFIDAVEIERAKQLIMGPRKHFSRDRARSRGGFFRPGRDQRPPRPE